MKYSYFKEKKQPPSSELTDTEIVNKIQHDEHLRNVTGGVRQCISDNDPKKADLLKGQLPAVTFSARFAGGRRYDKLVEYNGEIVLDFDKKTPEELLFIRQVTQNEPHTHLGFTSPKGNGYKLAIRTSLPDGSLPQSPEEVRNYHAHAYDQVSARYEELCRTDIDESGKDMTRLCYLPHDEDVFFQPDAPALVIDPTRPLREKKRKAPGRKKLAESPQKASTARKPSDNICYTRSENRALLATLLYYHDHKEKYQEGNRNNYLYKLACKYNYYGIPKADALPFLQVNFPDMTADEIDSLTASAYQQASEYNTRKLSTAQWNFLHVEQYISSHYDTRYNLIKHRMECSKKGEGMFAALNELMENSIWAELNEAGHTCSLKNTVNLIYSDFSSSFHPIHDFMELLPAWDGTDHIGLLADSVHTPNPEFWKRSLRNFLVGMMAAAIDKNVVNHICLLLCSKQNLGKTTFINNLLPPELSGEYLSTGIIAPGNKDDLSRLSEFLLINLDEYEGMNGRELSLLKDLITRKVISIRLPYAHRTENFQHIASFAGTCNYPQVLHDPTGNRRFLCFEIEQIDHIVIDYPQLYAQIKHLLESGYRYWFEAKENEEIERNNEPFIFQSPEEEMLLTHFRKPERFEHAKHMTVSEMAEVIRQRTGYTYSHASKILIGKILNKYGFQYTVKKNVKRYEIFQIDEDTINANQRF